MVERIVDFNNQRFLRDSRDFLRTGEITQNLRSAVLNPNPGYVDNIKKNMSTEDGHIIDLAVREAKESIQKEMATHRFKLNLLCQSTLESLETEQERFIIPEVAARYRDTINPVKALYYDIQEIMFLYNGKTLNKHHKMLLETFTEPNAFDDIMTAIQNDLDSLSSCKLQLQDLKRTYNLTTNGEYVKRVMDTYNEILQWQRLFNRFPIWISDNIILGHDKTGLCNRILKFFK